jgi:hypothetical protein
LLQIRTAKKHNLIGNRRRIRPLTAHVSKKLNPASRLSGLRQRTDERVGVHVVVNLMRIAPVARFLKGRAEDGRYPVQGRVCGFSISE